MKIDASDGWGKPVVRIALILCVLSLILVVWCGYDFITNKTNETILEEAQEDARNESCLALKNISDDLNSTNLVINKTANKIANDLNSGKMKSNSAIEKRLQEDIKNNPDVLSIAVAYSPAYHGNNFSLHYIRNGTNVEPAPIKYDYTDESEESSVWYINAMKRGHGDVNQPYFGKAAKTYLLVYSVPFYTPEFENGKKPAGVVAVSHSMEDVRSHIENIDLGNTGYGFIISREGRIISYPVHKYLYGNISELTKEDNKKDNKKDNNLDLINVNWTAKDSETDSNDNMTEEYRKTDPDTNQSYWIFREKISPLNWTLGVVLPREETLLDKEIEQKRSIIHIVLAAFAFFFSLCLLLVSFLRYEDKSLWLLALIFSLLCLLGIGVILHLTLNVSPHNGINGDNVVFDMAQVETVLQRSKISASASRIPTGVFLQSLEFSSAYDVIVTGYIWQNISNTSADYASPSFSFPESESEEDSIEKAYEDQDKGIVGWRFKTAFRQEFNYSRYPYDREDVWIKIWNNASSGNVLVPDFDSYDSLNPTDLPGLERSLVLEGWEPQRTYFSYRINSYNTNFGVGEFKHSNVPELYYNFDIKRDFKSPFTSYILPVIVVAILLFAVLMITTKDEKKEQCGFSSSDVLGYCSALFFVLIIAHASLRDTIPMDDIIYLEYFYFIMYLAILAVSLNSIAFASSTNFPFIDKKDNLYVKVLYWPIVMGVMLLVTLINFY